MRTAIFAGIPANLIQRTKQTVEREAGRFPEWQFRYVETQTRGPRLSLRDRRRVHAIAMQIGSVHVLGLSAERDRPEVAAGFTPYFRFRWIDNSLLWSISSHDPRPFVEMLVGAIAEENEWAARVQPQSLDSPLLLPECSFRCSNPYTRVWQRATSYGDQGCVPAAEKAIHAFKNAYYRRVVFQTRGEPPRAQQKWVDDIGLIFHDRGERHGVAPPPRDWKYSYRIAQAFHFDVTHVDQRPFTLTDAEGVLHRVPSNVHLKHVNLDPHGFVI